jgi:hypothetical protein
MLDAKRAISEERSPAIEKQPNPKSCSVRENVGDLEADLRAIQTKENSN